MPVKRVRYNENDDHNWLTPADEGKTVLVTGHWYGDFVGTVLYGGNNVAIIADDRDGLQVQICYMKPVQFYKL